MKKIISIMLLVLFFTSVSFISCAKKESFKELENGVKKYEDRYVYEDEGLYIVFNQSGRITEIKGSFSKLYDKILGKNYIYMNFSKPEFDSNEEEREFNKVLKIAEVVYKDTEEYESSKKKIESAQEVIKVYKELTNGIYIFVDPESESCVSQILSYSKKNKNITLVLKVKTDNKKLNPFRVIISEELVKGIGFDTCGEAVKIESGKIIERFHI